MKQAALLDGFVFDPFPFQRDDVAAPEVDVGRCEIVEPLVVAAVVVVIDKGRDLSFEVAREEVVFEQDAVLQRLVPALGVPIPRSLTVIGGFGDVDGPPILLDVFGWSRGDEEIAALIKSASQSALSYGAEEAYVFAPPLATAADPSLQIVLEPLTQAGWTVYVERRHYENLIRGLQAIFRSNCLLNL